MDKEVTKYTLINYLGDHTDENALENKEEAINKMRKLSQNNFESLVYDIVNEVHRRTDMDYDMMDTKMRKKLRKLKDEKLKNLISDVLSIYIDAPICLESEISNIHSLLSKLKFEEDISEKITNENNEKLKYRLFIEYVKNKYVSTEDKVLDNIIEFNNNSINNDFDNSFTILFNYNEFLKRVDNSKYINMTEYKVHKDNIQRYETLDCDDRIRRNLIKNEFYSIIRFVIKNQYTHEVDNTKIHIEKLIKEIEKLNHKRNIHLIKQDALIPKINASSICNLLVKLIEGCKHIEFIDSTALTTLEDISKSNILYNDVMTIITNVKKILKDIKQHSHT